MVRKEQQRNSPQARIDLGDLSLALGASAGVLLVAVLTGQLFIFAAEVGGHRHPPPLYDQAHLCQGQPGALRSVRSGI